MPSQSSTLVTTIYSSTISPARSSSSTLLSSESLGPSSGRTHDGGGAWLSGGDGSEDVEVCVDRRVSERLALGWATCTLVTSATDDEERASSHFASRARITFWSRWQEDATRTFEAKTRNRIVRRVLITWSSRALVRATRKWINAYMAREMRLQHLELAEAAHMHLFVARWAKLARPRRLLADYIARAVWRRKRQRLKGAVRVWRRLAWGGV